MKLKDKEVRFCQSYITDLNQKRAAIEAGYSEKRASATASELMAKPEIQEYISQLKKELQAKTSITAERVVAEFAKIGFSNIQDYLSEDNSAKDLTAISRKKAAPIASIKVTQEQYQDGDFHVTKTEFKLHDKVRALENLGRHLGIFEKDNTQGVPKKIIIERETIGAGGSHKA